MGYDQYLAAKDDVMVPQNQSSAVQEDQFSDFIYKLAAADAVADAIVNAVDTYGPPVVQVVQAVWSALQGTSLMFFSASGGVRDGIHDSNVVRSLEKARQLPSRVAIVRLKLRAHIEEHIDFDPPTSDEVVEDLVRGMVDHDTEQAFADFVDSVLQRNLLKKEVARKLSSAHGRAPRSV